MSNEADDVSRALAAFGVPKIRYHSFGQSKVRPASMMQPRRRVGREPELRASSEPEPEIQQDEPVAAPEPLPVPVAIPEPAMAEPLAPVVGSAPPALGQWNASIYATKPAAAESVSVLLPEPPRGPTLSVPSLPKPRARTLPELFAFLAQAASSSRPGE